VTDRLLNLEEGRPIQKHKTPILHAFFRSVAILLKKSFRKGSYRKWLNGDQPDTAKKTIFRFLIGILAHTESRGKGQLPGPLGTSFCFAKIHADLEMKWRLPGGSQAD
jgi:hypothetical protein